MNYGFVHTVPVPPVVEVTGWDESLGTVQGDNVVTVSNGLRTAAIGPDVIDFQFIASLPHLGEGTKLYVEVEFNFEFEPEGGGTDDITPFYIGLGSPSAVGAEGPVPEDSTFAFSMLNYADGGTEIYTNGIAGGFDLTVATNPCIMMLAWDKDNDKVYAGFDGQWLYGNPQAGTGGITVDDDDDLLLFIFNFITAVGNFTATDLVYYLPTGYTAWDGTTEGAPEPPPPPEGAEFTFTAGVQSGPFGVSYSGWQKAGNSPAGFVDPIGTAAVETIEFVDGTWDMFFVEIFEDPGVTKVIYAYWGSIDGGVLPTLNFSTMTILENGSPIAEFDVADASYNQSNTYDFSPSYISYSYAVEWNLALGDSTDYFVNGQEYTVVFS